MPFRAKDRGRREKCSVENRGRIVHNAEVTKKTHKLHNSTAYVNNCNLSTPDLVENRRNATDILYKSLHNLCNKIMSKVAENSIKQRKA